MNIINQIGSFMSSTAKEVMGILVWRYYKVLENKKPFLLLPWKLNKQTKKKTTIPKPSISYFSEECLHILMSARCCKKEVTTDVLTNWTFSSLPGKLMLCGLCFVFYLCAWHASISLTSTLDLLLCVVSGSI